eukprot:scaffold998_cov411-Prasinococcus_capsulatus_cf.AAC.21
MISVLILTLDCSNSELALRIRWTSIEIFMLRLTLRTRLSMASATGLRILACKSACSSSKAWSACGVQDVG